MGFYGAFVTRLNKLLIKTLTLNSVKTLKKKKNWLFVQIMKL